MRLGERVRESLAFKIAVKEGAAVIDDRGMIGAAQIGPGEMPGAGELDKIFWRGRLIVSTIALVEVRGDARIARTALIHHRHGETAQRLPQNEGAGVGGKGEACGFRNGTSGRVSQARKRLQAAS
jgi:hypothetical protein